MAEKEKEQREKEQREQEMSGTKAAPDVDLATGDNLPGSGRIC